MKYKSILSIFITLCTIHFSLILGWSTPTKHKLAIVPLNTKSNTTHQYLGPCLTEFLTSKFATQPNIEVIEPELISDTDSRNSIAKLLASKGVEYFVYGWIEPKDDHETVDLALIESGTGRILLEYGPKEVAVNNLNRVIDAFVARTSSIIQRTKNTSHRMALKSDSPVENVAKTTSDIRIHPDIWFKSSVPNSALQEPNNSLPPAIESLPFPPPSEEAQDRAREAGYKTYSSTLQKQGKETAIEKAHKRGWFSRVFMPWKGSTKDENSKNDSN